jgi:hypothetical protein
MLLPLVLSPSVFILVPFVPFVPLFVPHTSRLVSLFSLPRECRADVIGTGGYKHYTSPPSFKCITRALGMVYSRDIPTEPGSFSLSPGTTAATLCLIQLEIASDSLTFVSS